jgi:heat shock protein HslJ
MLMRNPKRLVAVVVATICVLVLSACSSPGTNTGGGDPALRGAWELTSARDAQGTLPLLHQNISLTVAASGKAIGRASCTDYTALVFGWRNSLWVSPTVPQPTFCTFAQLRVDRDYFAALRATRQFTVRGTTLKLTGDGVALTYKAAVNPSLADLVDQQWRLTTVRILGFEPTLESAFDQSGGVVIFGSSGLLTAQTMCAIYVADYTQSAGVVVAKKFASTPTALCTEFPQQPDADLQNLIRGGFTFAVKNGMLTLTSQRAGIALGFEPDVQR